MEEEIEINIEDSLEKSGEAKEQSNKKSLLKRFFSLKMIIIYSIVFLLLVCILFAVWFFFLKGPDKAAIDKAKLQEQKIHAKNNAVKKNKSPKFKDIVELKPFVKIKLKPSGKFSFLTMNIALKLLNNNMRQSIESKKTIIRRIIIREAGKMTWFVLRNPEGKLKLKYKLIAGINSALKESSKARIENLYFTHFIMQ